MFCRIKLLNVSLIWIPLLQGGSHLVYEHSKRMDVRWVDHIQTLKMTGPQPVLYDQNSNIHVPNNQAAEFWCNQNRQVWPTPAEDIYVLKPPQIKLISLFM